MTASADLSRQGNELAGHLVDQCRKRFVNFEQNFILAASTYLDPRFKDLTFKNKETNDVTKGKLLIELQKTVHSTSVDMPEPLVSTGTESSKTQTKGIWALLDTVREQAQQTRTSTTEAHVELRRYSEELTITREENTLDWWKARELSMIHLSKCAKKYLGIMAISVPSERLFSKAGLLVSDRRNRLKPENVNMMLFLNSYLLQNK